MNYFPIDISRTALARCQQELAQLDSVTLVGFERAYLDGLREVAARRCKGERLLVLFLGSTIGNFDRFAGEQFLREVRKILQTDDALLLATDLEKPVTTLKLAYDDPIGVTAAFNKNILARINRELCADFDLQKFVHEVQYDENERRVEMHLRSTCRQCISIRKARFQFSLREGETIWTESSHKYNPQEVLEMGERTGFHSNGQWLDQEWGFAQTLFVA